jgi:heme exporter protein D
MNWTEFFHMGGYAFYVWGSYGLAALIFVINIVVPLRQRKRLLRMHAENPSGNNA